MKKNKKVIFIILSCILGIVLLCTVAYVAVNMAVIHSAPFAEAERYLREHPKIIARCGPLERSSLLYSFSIHLVQSYGSQSGYAAFCFIANENYLVEIALSEKADTWRVTECNIRDCN